MRTSARRQLGHWPQRRQFMRCFLALGVAVAVLGSCPAARAASGTVSVFYAGSLVNLNENLVGPAFAAGSGYTYGGKGAGSGAIANQLKGKLATPDVVEFADPAVNTTLMGSSNGNYVSWYFTFGTSQMVIGFDPKSKVARQFVQVQRHKLPFYKALQQKGLRIGRTDPNIDPKGYRAIWMANLTQKVYKLKGFEQKLFGDTENPAQVFPEQVLVARMLTGQVNAGIFYLSEVKDLGIPYITLPPQVNLGSTKYARSYATQHFTTSTGQTITGAPIQYTITIPSTVKNEAGAEAFVRFVLSSRVRAISAAHGLLPLKTRLIGDRGAVPTLLTSLIGKT
jgi:molybdate/tungstate transport system substrate-binding protein